MTALLLITLFFDFIEIMKSQSCCIWGRDDYYNKQINGEYVYQGDFDGVPWFKRELDPSALYLWRDVDALHSKYIITVVPPQSTTPSIGYAVCVKPTNSPWECGLNEWMVLDNTGMPIDPQLYALNGSCPEWNCDAITTDINYAGCNDIFDIKIARNAWSNHAGDRYIWFSDYLFSWVCTPDDQYKPLSLDFVFAAKSEPAWIDTMIGSTVNIPFELPDNNTYSIQCTTLSPSQSPSQPTRQPTTYPTSLPTQDPSIQPSQATEKPTSHPSASPINQPTKTPTSHPSASPINQATVKPTSYPSASPINQATEQPIHDPTRDPTNKPTGDPSASPINQPHDPTRDPSTDPDDAIYCFEMVEEIQNLQGMESIDFIQDAQLNEFTLNSTKFVIYDSMRNSRIYDIESLCGDFWTCFDLTATAIYGNEDIVIQFDVCSWKQDVCDALIDKIMTDNVEMAVYMKQLLEDYLIRSQNTYYPDIQFSDTTKVLFTIITPAPTNDQMVIISTPSPTEMVQNASNSDNGKESVDPTIIIIIILTVLLLIATIIGFIFYRRSKANKSDQTSVNQQIEMNSKNKGEGEVERIDSDDHEGMSVNSELDNISNNTYVPMQQQGDRDIVETVNKVTVRSDLDLIANINTLKDSNDATIGYDDNTPDHNGKYNL